MPQGWIRMVSSGISKAANFGSARISSIVKEPTHAIALQEHGLCSV
jgi:hypothetical protein